MFIRVTEFDKTTCRAFDHPTLVALATIESVGLDSDEDTVMTLTSGRTLVLALTLASVEDTLAALVRVVTISETEEEN